jgi:glutaredoxin
MADVPLPDLILYGRPGCGLCAETRVLLTTLLDTRLRAGLKSPGLVERDIQTDPDWERAFFTTIPVIELGGQSLELAISAAKVGRFLSDILDT